MSRIIGILLISLSVIFCGELEKRKFNKKATSEDGIVRLLCHIKTMIEAGVEPKRLFESYNFEKTFSRGFGERLKRQGIGLLCDYDELKANCPSGDSVCAELADFSSELAVCPTAELCSSLCDKYSSIIKAGIEKEREKEQKRAALINKLSFVAAAAIFVMLI